MDPPPTTSSAHHHHHRARKASPGPPSSSPLLPLAKGEDEETKSLLPPPSGATTSSSSERDDDDRDDEDDDDDAARKKKGVNGKDGGAARIASLLNGKTSKSRLTLMALAALVAFYLVGSLVLGGDEDDDDDTTTSSGNVDPDTGEKIPPLKKNKEKKVLKDTEVIQITSKSGWTPQQGSLVEKRPPRVCLRTTIQPQVFDPIVYVSESRAGWKRRAFYCGTTHKSGACRHLLLEDAADRRWKQVKSPDVATFVFTDRKFLTKTLNSAQFQVIYRDREGSTYLDTILGGAALNGGPVAQHEARHLFVKSFGCSLNDLQISLPRFRVNKYRSECLEAVALAAKTPSKGIWGVYQSNLEGGALPTTTSTTELMKRLGNCAQVPEDTIPPVEDPDAPNYNLETDAIVELAMAKPLLLEKSSKFLVRSFLLIGSTMPYMVFFRQGYIRVAPNSKSRPYVDFFEPSSSSASSSSSGGDGGGGVRDMSLSNFQRLLANGKITGTHFVDTFLKSSMKRTALLLFHASRHTMRRRRGSYQLFALDFHVDDQLRVYLDRVDPYPLSTPISERAMDAGAMVADMHDLVMELGEEPFAFDAMIVGDKYGSFELIFSELKETCDGAIYNPCHHLYDYNAKPLAKANKRVSAVHNAANRERHEETRVRKKLDEEKKEKCKAQRLAFESKACEKLWRQLEDADFEKFFAEHEKSWNPNSFVFAKPGEVFSYEVV